MIVCDSMNKHPYRESNLLQNASKLPGSQVAICFTVSAHAHQFTRRKNDGSCPRIKNAHNQSHIALRIVLGVSSVNGNLLKVQWASQMHRRNNVSAETIKNNNNKTCGKYKE